MSSSYHYYVGPYIETRCPMVPGERSVRTCTGAACPVRQRRRHLDAAFCGRCGSPAGDVAYQEPEEAVDAHELQQQLNEALCDRRIEEGVRAWTPNVGRGAPRAFFLEGVGESGAAPLDDPGLPAREMTWLAAAFARELDALSVAFGAAGVRVRWGLVWRWS